MSAALVAALAAVPAASARPQAQQGIGASVAASIVAEIAKTGIKAGVAHFAPDLVKYTDPTAHGLAEIQAKLDELDRKMTQLVDHQQAMEEHLNCVTQKSSVLGSVTQARAFYDTFLNAAGATDPQAELNRLWGQIDQIKGLELHIHAALIGADGLIRACARHIESGMRPYLTSTLAYHVHNFYATYQAAEAALLVIRTNWVALHAKNPQQDAEALGRAREQQSAQEESWIKPAFPNTMSYDRDHQWLWYTTAIAQSNATLRKQLQTEGWHVTGHATIPTCSAILNYMQRGKRTGLSGLLWLALENVLPAPPPPYLVSCYDDHDHLHDFDLTTGTYYYADNVSRNPPSFAARANNGQVDILRYSYLG